MKTINMNSIDKAKNNYRKRIGILGGSFDPPTIAHITIARECIE